MKRIEGYRCEILLRGRRYALRRGECDVRDSRGKSWLTDWLWVCVCECEHKRLLPFVKNKYTWETPKGENLRLAAWGAFLLLFMCFYDSISLSLSYPQPISNNFVYVCVFPCQKSRQQAHKSAPLKRGKLHHWATFLFLRRISRAFVLCAKSKCVY